MALGDLTAACWYLHRGYQEDRARLFLQVHTMRRRETVTMWKRGCSDLTKEKKFHHGDSQALEFVKSPSSEVFETQLDKALSNLVLNSVSTLIWAGDWTKDLLKSLNYSMKIHTRNRLRIPEMLFKNEKETNFHNSSPKHKWQKSCLAKKYQFAHICHKQQYSIIQLTGTFTPKNCFGSWWNSAPGFLDVAPPAVGIFLG